MSKLKKQKNMIKFTIDGKEVQAKKGWTVLESARHYGIYIPTLCYHEAVKPSGACRLCVVEAREGDWSKIVVSCMYPPWEGVKILTDTERVRNVRRWILEMLLSECPSSREIQKLAAEYGIKRPKFKTDNPNEECILCGLCVRICEEVAGVRAISFGSRGVSKHIATPYMIPNKACVACGSCVSACPTGAMETRLDKVRGDVSQRTGHGFAH
jgi:NADH dehydrogenase/NADH:ubiquinone oxidoreductase subunit G